MLQLYRTLVRPLLEYYMQFRSPCYWKDIVKLEKVRKRFIRILPGFEGLSYGERLGLFSLELQRLRGGLMEFCKIMRSIDK
eukprot:g9808.t1